MVSEQTLRFISALELRPRMYLGNVKGLFSAFCGLVAGIDFAPSLSRSREMVSKEIEFKIPHEFRDFSLSKLGIDLSNTLGWQHHIAHTTESEDEAMALFFDLWRQFLGANGIEAPSTNTD